MNQSPVTTRRKHMAAATLGAAAIAMIVSGLAGPAVAQAELNRSSYNKCADAADKRWVAGQTNDATHIDEYKFCCIRAGGVWQGGNRGCVDAAATGPTREPQGPRDVVVPLPGEASALQ